MKKTDVEEERANEGRSILMTRRDLVKATMGIGALAAAGTAGVHLFPGTAEAAVRKLPTTWNEEVDVLIIGSGFAGLAAGAEAAGRGNKTVILEKMPTYGGNSIINGGEWATVDEKLHLRQKFNLGDDSVDLHVQDTLKGGDFYNIPELVKVMVEGSAGAMNWLIDEGGLKLREIANRAGGHSAYRTRTCAESSGRGFTEAERKISERNGAKIRFNQKVTWYWRKDWEGPVLGVEVQTPKGKQNIKVKKALILASGGFGRDIEMRKAFNPSVVPEMNCTNHPGATGETLRYAQAIGADALQLCFIQLYPFAEPETGILDAPAVYPFRGPGYGIIYVTREGKRYVSELERRDVCSRAAINTGMKPTFTIFSEKMIPLMGAKPEVEQGMAKGRFIQGDTIADLAKKLSIHAKNLEDTVAKHNGYLADKKDPDFGKPITDKMVPLVEGPFYGVAQWPAVHHTMGGLRINTSAQVIDVWGKPIPKLYAAGEITGGVHGSNRLGSNATPDAIVFGRIAGVNASKEKA
jgi:urocanate reductase